MPTIKIMDPEKKKKKKKKEKKGKKEKIVLPPTGVLMGKDKLIFGTGGGDDYGDVESGFGGGLLDDEDAMYRELANERKARADLPPALQSAPTTQPLSPLSSISSSSSVIGNRLEKAPFPMPSRSKFNERFPPPSSSAPTNPWGNDDFSDASSIVSALSQASIDPAVREAAEKQDILARLNRMKSEGFELSKKFTMRSSLDELRLEIGRCEYELDKARSIKYQRRLLMMGTTGLEFVNVKYGPIGKGKLNHWSETVLSEIDSYDGVFERLHDKYQATGKGFASPEIELATMLLQSMFMFVLNNNLMSAAMPSPEQILKDNPELVDKISRQLKEEARQKERQVEAFDQMNQARSNYNPAAAQPPPTYIGAPGGGHLGPGFTNPMPPPISTNGPGMDFDASSFGIPTTPVAPVQPPPRTHEPEPPSSGINGLALNIPTSTDSLKLDFTENAMPPPPDLSHIPGAAEMMGEIDAMNSQNAPPPMRGPSGMFGFGGPLPMVEQRTGTTTEIEEVLPSVPENIHKQVSMPQHSVGTRKGRRVRTQRITVTQDGADQTFDEAKNAEEGEMLV